MKLIWLFILASCSKQGSQTPRIPPNSDQDNREKQTEETEPIDDEIAGKIGDEENGYEEIEEKEEKEEISPSVTNYRVLKASGGGRVDWCAANNTIVYDSIGIDGKWRIFTIKPDGSDEKCVNCLSTNLPDDVVVGQPAWQPGCEWIIVQVENPSINRNFPDYLIGPGWGINNDLWMIPAAGGTAYKIDSISLANTEANLHPHFSHDGKKLFWTRRDITGTLIEPARGFPWNGWYLAVGDFYWEQGKPHLKNIIEFFREVPAHKRGFFESHDLSNGVIWFSQTLAPEVGQNTYVGEGYRHSITSKEEAENLTSGEGFWDEHVSPSPGGGWFAFASSRIEPSVGFPPNSFSKLQMGIYVRKSDLSKEPYLLIDLRDKLTDIEKNMDAGLVTSDFAWSPSGKEIAVYFVKRNSSGGIFSQQIIIAELNAAF